LWHGGFVAGTSLGRSRSVATRIAHWSHVGIRRVTLVLACLILRCALAWSLIAAGDAYGESERKNRQSSISVYPFHSRLPLPILFHVAVRPNACPERE
jgi:hypothetical protein